MEKYGFVYIWFDRKHKKFYIGSHWGFEDDGYICSSNWMRDAYKRRPNDFKRKIISKIYTTRYDLLVEEERWLSFIKDEEIGKRYYNLIKIAKHIYHANKEKAKSVYEKISQSHKNDPNWGSWSKGKKVSEETKQKLREANRKQFENEEQREMRRIKSKELWSDPEYLKKQNEKRKIDGFYKGFRGKHSEETKEKIRKKKLGVPSSNKGKMATEEQKQKMREAWVIRKQNYPTVSEETMQKFKNKVTAYDLFEKKFVKIHKQEFINNKDRYCGSTSNRIKENI